MQAANFELGEYLQRIAYTGPLDVNADTLRSLMAQQLCQVPFENLDVLADIGVSMTPEDIVEKLIHHQRGGYCYEVNGLFAMALEATGFRYRFLAARPMFYPVRRPRTHMVLLVSLDDGDWLCDCGFGSYGLREPVRLDWLDRDLQQGFDHYRLVLDEDGEYLLQALRNDEWANQYGFNLSPQEWVDFMPANFLNSNHPDVVFRQKPLLVKMTPEGRYILFGDELSCWRGGVLTTSHVEPEFFEQVVRDCFGLPWPVMGNDALK